MAGIARFAPRIRRPSPGRLPSAAAVLAAALAWPAALPAQPFIQFSAGSGGSVDGFHIQNGSSSTAGLLSGGYGGGNFGAAFATVSYGGVTLTANAHAAPNNGGGGGRYIASGTWNDVMTINAANPAFQGTTGTVTIPYNFSGNFDYQNPNNLEAFSGWTVSGTTTTIVFQTPPPSPTTIHSFTDTFDFTFGQPFGVNGHIDAQLYFSASAGYVPTPNGQFNLSLIRGPLSVTGGGNPVDYSAASSTGSVVAKSFAAGQTFAGLTVTNSGPGRFGTTATMENGTASGPTTVSLTCLAPIAGVPAVSDVVDVTGPATDAYGLKLSYSTSALQQLGAGLEPLLKWLDPADDTLKDPWLGDPDGGAFHQIIDGPIGPNANYPVGTEIRDMVNGQIKFFSGHTSEFVVVGVTPVPEPSSLALLAGCGGVAAVVRRRRRK